MDLMTRENQRRAIIGDSDARRSHARHVIRSASLEAGMVIELDHAMAPSGWIIGAARPLSLALKPYDSARPELSGTFEVYAVTPRGSVTMFRLNKDGSRAKGAGGFNALTLPMAQVNKIIAGIKDS